MVKHPKQGQIVYFRNTGTRSDKPILQGKVHRSQALGGEYWMVDSEDGLRRLLFDHELFTTPEEVIFD